MGFRTCLNHATILTTPLEKAVVAADRAGFEGFDFQEKDLDEYILTRKKKIKELVDLFDSLKIKPFCFSGLHRYMPNYMLSTDDEFEREKNDSIPLFEALKTLGVEVIITPELGRPVVPPIERIVGYSKSFEIAVKRNKQLSQTVKEYDLKVSLEYLGTSNFINSMSKAIEFYKQVNMENFGLALDSYHMYKCGDDLEDLEELPENSIFTVHVANTLDIPRNRITDFDRDYPLQGKLDLVPFLKSINKKKYDSYLTVELFREDYWREDPLKVAALAHKNLIVLINATKE